jgi:hypothetical protein
MKAILTLAALIVIVSFSFDYDYDYQTSQQGTDAESQRILAGLQTMHERDIHERLMAELDADRIERETEEMLWNKSVELTQHRELIARWIAHDMALGPQFQKEGDPPDPGIGFERAALTRIDARLHELADLNKTEIALRKSF